MGCVSTSLDALNPESESRLAKDSDPMQGNILEANRKKLNTVSKNIFIIKTTTWNRMVQSLPYINSADSRDTV